jgi:hypothetical protein
LERFPDFGGVNILLGAAQGRQPCQRGHGEKQNQPFFHRTNQCIKSAWFVCLFLWQIFSNILTTNWRVIDLQTSRGGKAMAKP